MRRAFRESGFNNAMVTRVAIKIVSVVVAAVRGCAGLSRKLINFADSALLASLQTTHRLQLNDETQVQTFAHAPGKCACAPSSGMEHLSNHTAPATGMEMGGSVRGS